MKKLYLFLLLAAGLFAAEEITVSAVLDKNSNEIIIKLVNAGDKVQSVELNFEGTKVFVDLNDDTTDYEDLRLMQNCKHNIIANSTFSWWAAWLNNKPGKRVIAPRQWSFPSAKFKPVVDTLIPSDWQII